MADVTRNSVLALKKETTEGVPVKPSSGADYVALQEGFSIESSFEELASSELQAGSIGVAKTVLGLENPKGSLAHYLRHSGVEGQEPNFGLLLESTFGGKFINATERETTSGSTVSLLKLASGGGDFQRGSAVLIKDGVNNYSIRNVLSVNNNDLTLAFNLNTAPSSGVKLGKCVGFFPQSETPSFTSWLFRGNGGAVEVVSGCRVSEFGITFEAGQFINSNFSFNGTEYFFNPLLVEATNQWLDFDEGSGELSVMITNKLYKDPHQLAEEIQSKMNSVATNTITVTYQNSTGKFSIATSGSSLSLLFKTGTHGSDNANTHIGSLIGFSDSTDKTASTSYTAESSIKLTAFHSATYDNSNPLVAKANQVLLGSSTDNICFSASSVNVKISNSQSDIKSVCATSGKKGTFLNKRECSIELTALLERFNAEYFKRFRNGDNIQFSYTAGNKLGLNWQHGTCVNVFSPTATITSHKLGDVDGLITLELSLKCYVESGQGEFFINFL